MNGSPGFTQPSMANKDASRSKNQVPKWTSQLQRKMFPARKDEPSKRIRTSSVNTRSSASLGGSSSTVKTDHRDSAGSLGFWRGNAVGREAKELLEAVEHHYPNTFQGVQIRSKPIWLTILKELHVAIKSFMGTSVDAVMEEQITGFEEDFKEFERLGFDLSWARKRIDMVRSLKFGNEPLRKELTALEESLEPLREGVGGRWKELMEAHDMWKKAQVEFDNAKDVRDKKAQEVAQKFGAEFERVLKGHLGFGMLPGY